MLLDILSCSVCLKEYHPTTCIPKTLPSCSHNVCKNCLIKILAVQKTPRCPTCNTIFPDHARSIESFQTALSILQVLETIGKCSVHNIPKKFVCMIEGEEICEMCRDRRHKDHEVVGVQEVRLKAEDKINQILKMKRVMENNKKMALPSIEEEMDASMSFIQARFNCIRELIDQQEEEFCKRIEREWKTLKDQRQKDSKTTKGHDDLREMIEYLQQPNINKTFLDMLNAPVGTLNGENEIEDEKRAREKIKEETRKELDEVVNYSCEAIRRKEGKRKIDLNNMVQNVVHNEVIKEVVSDFSETFHKLSPIFAFAAVVFFTVFGLNKIVPVFVDMLRFVASVFKGSISFALSNSLEIMILMVVLYICIKREI